MKIYTLRITYDDKTGDVKSLDEKITEEESSLTINASPHVMEAFERANLIGEVLVEFSGEQVGEA
jgi:hypothetical protein